MDSVKLELITLVIDVKISMWNKKDRRIDTGNRWLVEFETKR